MNTQGNVTPPQNVPPQQAPQPYHQPYPPHPQQQIPQQLQQPPQPPYPPHPEAQPAVYPEAHPEAHPAAHLAEAELHDSRLDTRGVTGKWLVETAVLIVLAFVIAMGVRMFLVEPYRIPTGSMLPTIQIDDQILIYKLGAHLGAEPETHDIVVFFDPTDAFPNLVKRVIATEGQTIDFSEDGQVLIDGAVIDEPYVHGLPTFALPPDPVLRGATIEYPFTVPTGMVWVMGDNRTSSSDSRSFGPVPIAEVKGTAFLTYWPLSNFAPLE